jgi:hypothetical protein
VLTCATVAAATAALVLTSTSTTVDAHKAKTSPFTYNVDIFPLLRDNCGRCHVEGGPAPMSLMTYDKDGGAIAWAESIREMLLAGAMPPVVCRSDRAGSSQQPRAHPARTRQDHHLGYRRNPARQSVDEAARRQAAQ